MRISKGLIIALVAALMVGALEAAGENLLQNKVMADSTEAYSVSVPAGHIGDRLAYARFTRMSATETWARASDSEYQITQLGKQADRTGMLHDAVFVTTNATDGGAGGLLGMESSQVTNTFRSTAVDLANGNALGGRRDDDMSQKAFFAVQTQNALSAYTYGPRNADAALFGSGVYEPFRLTSFQGQTYTMGETRPEVTQGLLVPEEIKIHDWWGAVDMHDLVASSTVAERGSVAGHDAVAVVTKGCVRFEVSDPRYAYVDPLAPNQIELFGIPVPASSHVCFTVKDWLSADTPYSLLNEVQLVIDETAKPESLTGLAAFDAGDVPIPWGQDSASEHYRSNNPATEHSPADQRYPADGTGTALTFPLSAALRAVAEDPTLLRYSMWRLQHPDAQLVGASMTQSDGQENGRAWDLVFAVPDGSAYVVTTEQPTPGAPTKQTEAGEMSVGAFSQDQPAAGPITFAAVETLWKSSLASPENQLVPNTAFWGFIYRPVAVFCESIEACGPMDAGFYANTPFDAVYLAHRPINPLADTRSTHVASRGNSAIFLVADAYDGSILLHAEFSRAVNWEPLASSPNYKVPEPRSIAGVPGATAVSIEHAAFASMSFLAFVLLAYFFPTLKFVGTKALFFVPGFARIQKSELLQNKVRETMVTAIRADPGVTAPQLQTLTGSGWSTVVYHLGVLERAKLVSSFVDGRHKRFFPVETIHSSDRARVALLKNARTKGLYQAILGEPGVGFSDLARELGISRPALYWHVDRLTKAGMVGQDRDGNRVRFYANENHAGLSHHDPHSGTEVS